MLSDKIKQNVDDVLEAICLSLKLDFRMLVRVRLRVSMIICV
jgi:hypothetical protein